MTTAPDRYAVAGFPVKHSWSPFIHGMFAKQTGQDLTYRLLEVSPDRLQDELRGFFSEGGLGLNITLPHKQSVARLVHKLTRRAEIAGAVNTIANRDGEWLGDNTDGAGLVTDLERNLKFSLKAKRVLMLGAGGAARGVLGPLLDAGVASILIANRDVNRAQELSKLFSTAGDVSASSFADVDGSFDLVLNATAASLKGEVPPVSPAVIGPQTLCYDMAYGTGDTAFTMWAKGYGAKQAVTGWGMLVEQAAEAFHLWRGVRPDTAPVLEAISRKASGTPVNPPDTRP